MDSLFAQVKIKSILFFAALRNNYYHLSLFNKNCIINNIIRNNQLFIILKHIIIKNKNFYICFFNIFERNILLFRFKYDSLI